MKRSIVFLLLTSFAVMPAKAFLPGRYVAQVRDIQLFVCPGVPPSPHWGFIFNDGSLCGATWRFAVPYDSEAGQTVPSWFPTSNCPNFLGPLMEGFTQVDPSH